MAPAKSQLVETNAITKSTWVLKDENQDDGKMQGLPQMFLKTNELRVCHDFNRLRTRDV